MTIRYGLRRIFILVGVASLILAVAMSIVRYKNGSVPSLQLSSGVPPIEERPFSRTDRRRVTYVFKSSDLNKVSCPIHGMLAGKGEVKLRSGVRMFRAGGAYMVYDDEFMRARPRVLVSAITIDDTVIVTVRYLD